MKWVMVVTAPGLAPTGLKVLGSNSSFSAPCQPWR
jgi:hypothetical protein